MIQLQILSGKMAGNLQVVRHFPFAIGRSRECELQLNDEGVWDQHLALLFQPPSGYVLQTANGALVAVNDQLQTLVRLRNGDIFSLGATKIQFWLAAPRQRGLQAGEFFVWLILILITIGQGVLIYGLLWGN